MPLSPDDLLTRLRERGIAYKLYEHEAVLTVEAMMAICGDIAGAHTKNLFLRDGKKTYFLVTLQHDAQVDLKAFRAVLGARGGLSFASADALLAAGGAIGRKLDFLAQELGREANTLCAKANDIALSRIGLDLKAVVEQFREQVQNVE